MGARVVPYCLVAYLPDPANFARGIGDLCPITLPCEQFAQLRLDVLAAILDEVAKGLSPLWWRARDPNAPRCRVGDSNRARGLL